MDGRSASSNRTITVLLIASVALCAVILGWTEDSDADNIASGTCGDLSWTYDYEGVLTITGIGEMDFDDCGGEAPWKDYTDYAGSIKIGEGVKSIASNAFPGCSYLESITIPSTIISIESDAFGPLEFYDTDGTTRLDITVDNLEDSTFTGSAHKMVKQTSGDDPSPEPEKEDIMSPIAAITAGILSAAVILLLAIRY